MTLEERLNDMSLFEWISVFGSITDQNSNNKRTYKKRIPFTLWPRQAEACDFMELHKVLLMPKSRQKGYSEMAAERALFTLFKNENIEGVCVSIGEKEAAYFLKKRVMAKYSSLCKKFPGQFPALVRDTKEELEFEGNRIFRSIASSNTAAASMTLDFLIIDEAGGIDENRGTLGIENSTFKPILTNSMPSLSQNPSAWAMVIGTSVPGSYYNHLVREAYESNNETLFKYFFIGWYHQPGRDAAWYEAEKELQKDDMPLQNPTDMNDFFFIKDGLVFQHFDHREGGRHIVDFKIGEVIRRKVTKGGKSEIQRFKPSWNHNYITAYDHGTNHPAVELYSMYDELTDMLYVFDEVYYEDGHGTDVGVIAKDLNRKRRSFPRKPDRQIADGAIYNDIGVESVGNLFAKYKLKFKKAKKSDESASRDLVQMRFRENKIMISPKCYNLIRQLKSYRWDVKSKGEKPIQKDDDAIDDLRYTCAECKKGDFIPDGPTPANYKIKSENIDGGWWDNDDKEDELDENSWMAF
jgi:hypothetical protein